MLKHISFGEGAKTLAILVPTKDLDKNALEQHYVKPLEQMGIPRGEIVALNLQQKPNGKAPVKDVIKPWLETLGKAFPRTQIRRVLICDGNYFKTICKVTKSDPHYGQPLDTVWPGIRGFVCPNYRSYFYNPGNTEKTKLSLEAIYRDAANLETLFEQSVLHNVEYPQGIHDIRRALDKLLEYPELTCDIETYSLNVYDAGLGSIAFGIDEHTAVSFFIGKSQAIRQALQAFFINYCGQLIFHGSTFDIKVLIWELFMDHPRDYEGMLMGLDIMFRDMEDTKILAYLALNSTSPISLGLKDLALEFAGNYAMEDIKDIKLISTADLLKYNATDAVATHYVRNKYREQVRQEQEEVYQTVFKPSLKVITQMELCGVPINLGRVLQTEQELDDIARKHYKKIMSHPDVIAVQDILRDRKAIQANLKLKKKRKTRQDFLHEMFNPGSHVQLQVLLYEYLGLPVIETTDTDQPATGAKTLAHLVEHVRLNKQLPQGCIPLLEHLIGWSEVTKILNTFIPAFKNSSISKDGWQYLHGNFNLGGTKSGRLSSSGPNLQNIPSTGTKYAKPVKRCFQAPPHSTEGDPNGWLMVGADYSSLEDRVSALLTKDPNKLDIYIKGYDGHCLRAYAYFGEQMPDITQELEAGADRVATINSIAHRYPDLRQLSKSPTFLLTYFGTAVGLVKTFGFDPDMALQIEQNFHELYKVSDQWVDGEIEKASKCGYVELAFGLRLRTPILPQVILGSASMPSQAHKEIKTAGNALGQSYGLLNNHTANLFMQRVWDSPFRTSILPIMQVHDSQYYMIRNRLDCLKFVNDNLIECMEWNELAPIQHDIVKLGASLELYWPDWAHPISIPNRVSTQELRQLLQQAIQTGSAGS